MAMPTKPKPTIMTKDYFSLNLIESTLRDDLYCTKTPKINKVAAFTNNTAMSIMQTAC